MSGLFGKILWGLFTKLVTEKFVAKFLVIGLWNASQMSTNKVDDKLVDGAAEALGVDPKVYK